MNNVLPQILLTLRRVYDKAELIEKMAKDAGVSKAVAERPRFVC
jgi:hypothetical protein